MEGKKLIVTSSRTRQVINLAEVQYLELSDHQITAHLETASFRFYNSLSELTKALEEEGFARIHRAVLIPLERVEKIGRSEVRLKGLIKPLPVGSGYEKSFKKLLSEKGFIFFPSR